MIAYLVLITRLFYIQVIRSPHFKAKAEELTVRHIVLPAKRGTMYDRNLKKLAVSTDAYDIYVQPRKIKDKEGTAAQLAPLIGWDQGKLLARLQGNDKFIYVERRADVEMGKRVKEAKIPNTGVLPTMKRIYPGGSLAAHIIGFTNVDGKGIEGLEKVYDKVLRGSDGYVIAQVDARGKIIPGSKRKRVEPIHGDDLVLTIDSTMQHALEMALRESYEKWSAAGASAVMMDPKTGEILALANMPTFEPGNVAQYNAASRRNRAVTDLYEPGSTLKTITVSAGLEEKAITPNDTFHCRGSMRIGRRIINCSLHAPFMGGHGTVNATKILRYSCNMGAAGIGLRLGKESLYKYEQAFDLYVKPGSEMPGEMYYVDKDRWQDWADVHVANIAFGQGIAMTPLQLTKAYAAVANGGLLMRPYVVKEIKSADGKLDKVFGPHMIRRVISEETAGLVAEMLYGAVNEAHGTGKNARVEGYRVAGKTGSAQKASGGGYGGQVVSSFAGFLPISDPRVVILVAVDEPHGSHYGAVVAAPVFQQAARKAMWHLKVPPDDVPKQKPSAVDGDGGGDHADEGRGSPGRNRLGG